MLRCTLKLEKPLVKNHETDRRRLDPVKLSQRYRKIRDFTHRLAKPLAIEDYVVQSMEDVSPTKWHLAHTSWFFETFVLSNISKNYQPFHHSYTYLFNSYYLQAGERHSRSKRGLISRPTVEDIYAYRTDIDEKMKNMMGSIDKGNIFSNFAWVIEIGLHHEQQHQELILTDIKHVLSQNPIKPAYVDRGSLSEEEKGRTEMRWLTFEKGLHQIGHDDSDFGYDNEFPKHRVYIEPFCIASRPVTNGEYIDFIRDGGYSNASLWLSDGWDMALSENWQSPLYWECRDGEWRYFTLSGMREMDIDEPVCHVSFYEADAFARWAGVRLPSEFEWEVAVKTAPIKGNFIEDNHFHPLPRSDEKNDLSQVYGDVWEWTSSPYIAYPGYTPPKGAIGEYNGKFMCNQIVLRGGSCATSKSHIRKTYRNFFPPNARWQFSGIRLAKNN